MLAHTFHFAASLMKLGYLDCMIVRFCLLALYRSDFFFLAYGVDAARAIKI